MECGDKTDSIRLRVGARINEVQINGAYLFTDLKAVKVPPEDRDMYQHPFKSECDLKLTETSSIIRFDHPPYRAYKYTPIETLHRLLTDSAASDENDVHDVAGVCIKVGDKHTEPMRYKNGTKSDEPVIELTIVDKSTGLSEGFPLAVIGKPAEELAAIGISPPFFVAVKNGRLKTFKRKALKRGRINSGVTNMITIPQLCTLHDPYLELKEKDLMTWYDMVTNQKEEGSEEKKRKRDNSAAEGDVVTPVKKERPDE